MNIIGRLIGFLFLILTSFCFGQRFEIDSLLNILKTVKEDTARIKTLEVVCKKYILLSEFDKAINYAEQEKLFSDKLISSSDKNTIRAGKKARASAFNLIASAHFYQGAYPKALENYLKSLSLREEIGDKKNMAALLSNIGNIYCNQGDYVKAMEKYTLSLNINEALFAASPEDLAVKNSLGIALGNMGTVYLRQNNLSKALEHFSKALIIKQEAGNKLGVADTYVSLGVIYGNQKDYSKALKNYLESLKVYEELGNKGRILLSYVNIAKAYTSLKNFGEAVKYNNMALSISKETGQKEFIKESYLNLSWLNEKTGNYKLSLEQYKLYIIYKDSLFNEEATRKTVQSQMTYDFDKKEQAAKLNQEKKDAIAKEEKEKQEIIRNAFIGGFAFIFLIAVLIFKGYRNKQKSNIIITKQKEEVESAKNIIEDQKKHVEEKQKEILDSINYARRIQLALLPAEKLIDKTIKRLKGF